MPNNFHTAERLKSAREIGRLFARGSAAVSSYPVRIVFREAEQVRGPHPFRVTFVVPKRKFKRAVDRNLLKRRMREAYRLNKEVLAGAQVPGDPQKEYAQVVMLVMYTGKEALPYALIERKLVKLLRQVAERLTPGA